MIDNNEMSKSYDVIFVGAGLGSLSAASLLAQRGKKVLVVDKHNVPGGYASNFTRKDFEFDVSLHSFDGVVKGANSYKVIEDCGIDDKVEFLANKTLYHYQCGDVDIKVNHRDLESYKRQLFHFFPEEKNNIIRLFDEADKNYNNMSGFLYSKKPFWLRIILTPLLYHRILKYENDTVDSFFSRYTSNEELKKALSAQWSYYGLPAKELAFGYFSYPFIDYLRNGGYLIKGGSQKLSNALVEVIKENNGTVLLSSPVSKIIVSDNKVKGIETKKYGFIESNKIVSNVSPHATITLSGEKCFDKNYLKALNNLKLSLSGFQVYLGLDCTLQSLGVEKDEYIRFFSPQISQSEQFKYLQNGDVLKDKTGWSINYYSNVDDSLVKPGKSSLGLFTLVGAEDWHSLSKIKYRAKKKN